MKDRTTTVFADRLRDAADEQVWTRAVVRLVVLCGVALGISWWWQGAGGVGPTAREALPAPQKGATWITVWTAPLSNGSFVAWVAIAMLIPAYHGFWFRNRSAHAGRTWRAHWTLAFWALLLHLLWWTNVTLGWDFRAMVTMRTGMALWPALGIAAWWLLDIWLASSQPDESPWAGVQRILLHGVVLAFVGIGALWQGDSLIARLLGAAVVAAAVISAHHAWKRRDRAGRGPR